MEERRRHWRGPLHPATCTCVDCNRARNAGLNLVRRKADGDRRRAEILDQAHRRDRERAEEFERRRASEQALAGEGVREREEQFRRREVERDEIAATSQQRIDEARQGTEQARLARAKERGLVAHNSALRNDPAQRERLEQFRLALVETVSAQLAPLRRS